MSDNCGYFILNQHLVIILLSIQENSINRKQQRKIPLISNIALNIGEQEVIIKGLKY